MATVNEASLTHPLAGLHGDVLAFVRVVGSVEPDPPKQANSNSSVCAVVLVAVVSNVVVAPPLYEKEAVLSSEPLVIMPEYSKRNDATKTVPVPPVGVAVTVTVPPVVTFWQ